MVFEQLDRDQSRTHNLSPHGYASRKVRTCGPCIPNGFLSQKTLVFIEFFVSVYPQSSVFVHGQSWGNLGADDFVLTLFSSNLGYWPLSIPKDG
jgi:hypothetical protein